MKEYAHRYRKLGGWLLVFVILTYLAAFSTLTNQFQRTGFLRSWQNYTGGEFWLQLAIQLCAIYAITMRTMYATMIIRRNPHFVRTWQLLYIGTFVNAAAQLALHLAYGYPDQGGSSYNSAFAIGLMADIFAFLPIPIGLTLFTLYFVKSVRVRTYLRSDNYLRLAFFTRKATPVPFIPDEEV